MRIAAAGGWLALLVLAFGPVNICVAELAIPAGAKVGLVLSGGGARGLAHVGVIQVLEAQGIKPDIITGTSMGSIVGALYASGRSADSIERIASTINWTRALKDSSPRMHQPYPFRQLEAGMTADLRMSVTASGIAFPRGAIEGQHLEQQLNNLFSSEGVGLTFEQLPIKFAAVAADLETGQQVVMSHGDVASAVRASMSIPGAIAPIVRDGKLLVDGGIANNMPINLAREMGADYIIAVDVTAPLRKQDELTSIFAVAGQTTAFLVRLNTVEQRAHLRPDETLILPELNGFSSAAFDQSAAIIQAGRDAAEQALGISGNEIAELESELADNLEPQLNARIEFIQVTNDSPVSDAVVRSYIRQRLGEPLDVARLQEDISRLYGLDYFSVVRYRVVNKGKQKGLDITCIARETGNVWLKLGLELADDLRGNSDFGLSASVRAAGLNRLGGTLFGRLKLGTYPEFETRFLQPVDTRQHYFIEPAFLYTAGNFDLYLDDIQDVPIASYQKEDLISTLSVGRTLFGEAAELRLGVVFQRGQLDLNSGLDFANAGGNDADYEDGYYFMRFGWDTLDDLGFPTQGSRWSIAHEEHRTNLNAENNFNRMDGMFTLAFSHARNTLLLEADAEIGEDDSNFADIPFIGGFLELSGLPPRARFGLHRALVRSVFYHRLNKQGPLPLGVPVYVGMSLEKGNVWLERDNISWTNAVTAGSVFIGARTPLGPAYFSIGATNEGDRSVSLFLGQRFR